MHLFLTSVRLDNLIPYILKHNGMTNSEWKCVSQSKEMCEEHMEAVSLEERNNAFCRNSQSIAKGKTF